MLLMYFSLLFFLLSLVNAYIVWLIMELTFLYFLLLSMVKEEKSVGLVLYFFFQSVVSLFLFIAIIMSIDKFIFLFLSAKLGLFPFFYWMVVVSVKVGFFTNFFVLGLQKISVFWLFWLLVKVNFMNVLLFVYLSVFFVVIMLMLISDLWLVLVYSSIANTSMILLSVYGSQFLFLVFMYLIVVMMIIYLLSIYISFSDMLIVVFFFLVIPPFFLFFMKFFLVLSMDSYLKIIFFLMIFDVLVLLYYFSLIFMKFMLMETGMLVYLMSLLILLCVLVFSNYVAMIIFYKS